jgi:hypothetical protein
MLYKLSRLAAVLTILSLVIFFACRKTDFSSSAAKNKAITDPSVALDVPLAKRYYKILKTEQGIDVTAAHIAVPASDNRPPNTKHPIWQRAVTGETSKAWFVEVPLFYNQRPSTVITLNEPKQDMATTVKKLNASFDRLVIFKNKQTGKVDQRIVTYMPDTAYLNKHGKDISNNGINRMDKNFSGYQVFRKWDGTTLFARKIKDGKIEKRFKAINQQSKNRARTATTETYVCDFVCIDHYEQRCYTTISGEFETTECGDWEYVGTDCYDYCYDDGSDDGGGDDGGGDPCYDYGDCGGGDNNPDDPPTQNDPCADAQPGANKATSLSQNATYQSTKSTIRSMASDGLEHGVSFGKDANGNVITSSISTGNDHTASNGTVDNRFADMHNHPSDLPPSSGDLYGFIDLALAKSNYESRYIVTPNGTVYALVVTNRQQAQTFNTNYPRVPNPGYEPGFPDALVDEFNELKGWYHATDEMAMAYILEKYNAGVALVKQDANGNFKALNTDESVDANGTKTYVANNCQ